jgi:hypothetical protein
MKKKCLLISLLAFQFSILSFSQIRFDSIYLRPLIGIRNHNEQLPNLANAGRSPIANSPVLGLRLGAANFPLSLSFQKDVFIIPNIYSENVPNFAKAYPFALSYLWTESHLMADYHFRYFSISAGYYWAKRETYGNFLMSGLSKYYKGFILGMRAPLKWMDIEFRTKLSTVYCSNTDCISNFAALGWSQHNLLFLYDIGRPRNNPAYLKKRATLPLEVNGLLGFRLYPSLNTIVLPSEKFEKVSFAPAFGIEILWTKYRTSFNLEKDIWVAFNGGSRERFIKGYVRNYFIGSRYHCLLKNNRNLRFGAGGAFVKDSEKSAVITPSEVGRFGLFQMKGIGLSVSYEIFKQTDLEFRHLIPVSGLNEKSFNPARMSLGLLYRHNPSKR